MAFPVIAARIGWTILGIAIGAVAKSEFGKEAKDMFKDGLLVCVMIIVKILLIENKW
jgi:uncharacterized membrane protein AbrB (regulator of aidB expression)